MFTKLYKGWIKSYSGLPRVIWLLALVNFVNRCGGMAIAFISIYLTQHLGFDIPSAGFIMGCFGAGSLVGALMGGWLTDRFGFYKVQIGSLLLNGLALLLMLLIRDFWALCATTFAVSAISDTFRPANTVAVAIHSQPETRTRSMSLQRMAFNLGWTIAPSLGGILASFGWHWLFLVDGLTCVLAAIMLFLILPQSSKNMHPKGIMPIAHNTPVQPKSPWKDKPFLFFLLITLLNAAIFMQFLWTVPKFFEQEHHWNIGMVGMVTALNGLIVFMVEMPLIFKIEKRWTTMQLIRFGIVLYALAYASFLLPVGALVGALMYIIFISFGEIFVMPFSTNYVIGCAENGSKGQYIGLYSVSYALANIAAPILGTQIIARQGFGTLWVYTIGLCVLAWIGVKVLKQ